MKSITVMFYIFSIVLFMGSSKFLISLNRQGVYPPKQVIKKRAQLLAGAGGICLLLAIMFSYFW